MGGINFRQFPSRVSSTILGAVNPGQMLRLAGRTAFADGVEWHQAISPALVPATTPGAQNRLDPNQVGWIAACFVGA